MEKFIEKKKKVKEVNPNNKDVVRFGKVDDCFRSKQIEE